MDGITGINRALDYIESHITEDIDVADVAAQCYLSSYHFSRIFGILCGFTVGEYVRSRRLSLAGAELASGELRVIDAAMKYGYDSPDSFAKAFRKFHGILPSEARLGGKLRTFSRLMLKFSMEGGKSMNYRIEEQNELSLTGFRTHFTGSPYAKERLLQEEELFVTTRAKQWFLKGASGYGDEYCFITNVTDEGYDFFYTHKLDGYVLEHLYDHSVTGVDFIEGMGLETIVIPKSTYLILETPDSTDPIGGYSELIAQRVDILSDRLPEMGFRLKDAPELAVYHWMPKSERRISVMLPIEKF